MMPECPSSENTKEYLPNRAHNIMKLTLVFLSSTRPHDFDRLRWALFKCNHVNFSGLQDIFVK